jgi:hypothetical protein
VITAHLDHQHRTTRPHRECRSPLRLAPPSCSSWQPPLVLPHPRDAPLLGCRQRCRLPRKSGAAWCVKQRPRRPAASPASTAARAVTLGSSSWACDLQTCCTDPPADQIERRRHSDSAQLRRCAQCRPACRTPTCMHTSTGAVGTQMICMLPPHVQAAVPQPSTGFPAMSAPPAMSSETTRWEAWCR